MIRENFGADFIIACVFVGSAMLVGLFTLFARAENIERPLVVGGMTISGALFAMILLDHLHRIHFNFGYKSLFWVCLVSVLGFALGRLIDWALGPRTIFQGDGESLDTNLAD